MSPNRCKKLSGRTAASSIVRGLLITTAAVAVSGIASAQDKKDEISFRLVPNPQFVDCLRANSYEVPRAHATVIRGNLNDTLILDLYNIKPGLAFDLFTVQRSPFQADGSSDHLRAALVWLGISQMLRFASTPMMATSASRQSFSTKFSGSIPMWHSRRRIRFISAFGLITQRMQPPAVSM